MLCRGRHAFLYERKRDDAEALEHYARALAIARRGNDRFGEALVLNNLGDFYGVLGRYEEAASHLRQGFVIALELEDIGLGVHSLSCLGPVYSGLGLHSLAIDYLNSALTGPQARVHHGIARTHRARGDTTAVREHLEAALKIYNALNAPEADEIHQLLESAP